MRWLGNTRQAVVHGFARVALVEGLPWPDVNFHMGTPATSATRARARVFEAGFTLGTKAPSAGRGPRNAKISPFVDISVLTMTSTPGGRRRRRSGRRRHPRTSRRQRGAGVGPARAGVPKFSGGVQWVFGQVSPATGGYTLNATPYAAASLGFTY